MFVWHSHCRHHARSFLFHDQETLEVGADHSMTMPKELLSYNNVKDIHHSDGKVCPTFPIAQFDINTIGLTMIILSLSIHGLNTGVSWSELRL